MGYEQDVASGAVRVSLGPDVTEEQVVRFAEGGVGSMKNSKRVVADVRRHSGAGRAPTGQPKECQMAAMDGATDLEVQDGVDQETVETVANMGTYKYGWKTEIEMEFAPKG